LFFIDLRRRKIVHAPARSGDRGSPERQRPVMTCAICQTFPKGSRTIARRSP
jgi:hypothetical protein